MKDSLGFDKTPRSFIASVIFDIPRIEQMSRACLHLSANRMSRDV
jgi:hypothetical protein